MPTDEPDRVGSKPQGERRAELRVVDHQLAAQARIVLREAAMIEYGDLFRKKSGHVKHGAERPLGRDAERDHAQGVAVHDGLDVRADLVDFTVDEPFAVRAWRARIDRYTVGIELDDVVCGHERRWHRPRHEIMR